MAAFVHIYFDDEGDAESMFSVPAEDVEDMAAYLRKLADEIDETDAERPAHLN